MPGKIIKFPKLPEFCGDCAKPLDSGEGVTCLTDGCGVIFCIYCEDVSAFCMEHMEEDCG